MQYELYIDRGRWVHRLHPATKMVGLLVVFAVALLFNRPLLLLPLFLFVFILPFTTGVASALKRFAFPLAMLAALCFVLWSIFSLPSSGDTPTRRLLFGIPQAALEHASAMTLRIITMVLAGISFFATTTVDEFCTALVRMRVPQPVAFAFTLSLRLFPAFVQSAFRILDAQRSRGLKMSGNPIRRTLAYIPLIIPVFINSLHQMHRLSLAIESRGYNPNRKRTSFLELRFRAADGVFIALSLCALAASILLRVLYL